MALICPVRLLTDQLIQSWNTNQTHFIPQQILFGSSSSEQSHSLRDLDLKEVLCLEWYKGFYSSNGIDFES
jgi:hypothetical protein